MNPRHRSEFYNHDDREAAAVLLAECADKPIRKMGPLDYSASWPSQRGPIVKPQGVKEKAISARYKLAKECEKILRERGACTTVELSLETGKNTKAVGYACNEIDGIQVQDLTLKGSRTKLWMVRGRSTR
jgi:hypothetical protein